MTNSTLKSAPPRGVGHVHAAMIHVQPVVGAVPATHVLESEPLAIGRIGHVAGPLAVPDPEVSRHHATIEPCDGGWVVVDHASRNGTFVDGKRVERAPLVDGSV